MSDLQFRISFITMKKELSILLYTNLHYWNGSSINDLIEIVECTLDVDNIRFLNPIELPSENEFNEIKLEKRASQIDEIISSLEPILIHTKIGAPECSIMANLFPFKIKEEMQSRVAKVNSKRIIRNRVETFVVERRRGGIVAIESQSYDPTVPEYSKVCNQT